MFSGGSGVLGHQEPKEAHYVAPVFARLGLDPTRIVFEDRSRNTAENAQLSKKKMNPTAGENWLLVTSAFHMPRAVGSFRKVGWPVIPYPVDYNTTGRGSGGGVSFRLSSGLSSTGAGLHEWLGLLFYRLTGRTDELYPGPNDGGAVQTATDRN